MRGILAGSVLFFVVSWVVRGDTGCYPSLTSFPPCKIQKPFPEAMLSTFYAPGECHNRRCKSYSHIWTIHGLWPNYGDGSWPADCCSDDRFNKAVLTPIMEEMTVRILIKSLNT